MTGDLIERLRAVPPFERRSVLRGEVLAEFRTALLMSADEELPLDANYFELGLTSLGVTELKQRLERRLGQQVEAASLFSHPTVGDLLDNLVADLPELFARTHGPDATPDADATDPAASGRSAESRRNLHHRLVNDLLTELYQS